MRVVTMALMDLLYYILAISSLGLAFFSASNVFAAYFSSFFLVIMFVLLFWSIPLKLNWSSNLYGHLFRRFIFFLFFMIFVYAICYYNVGFERADDSSIKPTFLEAIYFSVTSFTTLQFGEFRPLPGSRALVCIESLMGIIAFVPFFASFGWLYCQNRLWPQSLEDQSLPNDLSLTPDPELGGWKEIESDKSKAESEKRNSRLALLPCNNCGSTEAKIEKIYDMYGRTTPLALFVVHCSCGAITKPSTTAFLAAWRWKKLKKKRFFKRKASSNDTGSANGRFSGPLIIKASKGGTSKKGNPEKMVESKEKEDKKGDDKC